MAGSNCNARKRPAGDRDRWPRNGRESNCQTCGARFASQSSGKVAGGWTRFCSAPCYQLNRSLEAGSLPRVSVVSHHGHCSGCGRHYRKAVKGQRYCSESCSPTAYAWAPMTRICIECSNVFDAGKWQRTCSTECRDAVSRRGIRKSKAARRARESSATIKVFDPIAVLERDRWTCKLCGARTPRTIRGTTDPMAPELDHVVPLSVGGEHSMENTQCACRRCNIAKGSKPLGQLNLPV